MPGNSGSWYKSPALSLKLGACVKKFKKVEQPQMVIKSLTNILICLFTCNISLRYTHQQTQHYLK